MRLFNRIIATPEGKKYVASCLPDEPQIIVADNVSNYYWQGTDQEFWDLDVDFANIAPPFRNFLIDWRAPSRIVSSETGVHPWSSHLATEFAMIVAGRALSESHEDLPDGILRILRQLNSAHWMLVCTGFLCGGKFGQSLSPAFSAFMFADKHGHPVKMYKDGWFTTTIFKGPFSYICERMGKQDTIEALIRPILDVALLTLSFMHCKNVALETVVPDAKLAKRTMERSGIPLHRYQILNIDPMKAVLQSSASAANGLVQHGKAVHICRGHFKDYREHGLFGKNKNIYWWGQQARGSADRGTVDKLYSVEAGNAL